MSRQRQQSPAAHPKRSAMFRMDQADLKFGLYRIMSAKQDEISQFLEQNLLPRLRKAELAEGADLERMEDQVCCNLYTFFSRYYPNGDFLSLRRYKEGMCAMPYENAEVVLLWANADPYCIKSSENFSRHVFKTTPGQFTLKTQCLALSGAITRVAHRRKSIGPFLQENTHAHHHPSL